MPPYAAEIEALMTNLIDNPYQRPEVCDAPTFLKNVADNVRQDEPTLRYFTQHPVGLDEISRHVKTDKDLKARLVEKRTFFIETPQERLEASILDLIRLHRSEYRPLELTNRLVSIAFCFLIRAKNVPLYTHERPPVKNSKLSDAFHGKYTQGDMTSVNSPIGNLNKFLSITKPTQPRTPEALKALISLAQSGDPIALSILLKVQIHGLEGDLIFPANTARAQLLARQLEQFEHSPVALYHRAYFAYQNARAAEANQNVDETAAFKAEVHTFMTRAAEQGHEWVRHLLALDLLFNREASYLPLLNPMADEGERACQNILNEIEAMDLPEESRLRKVIKVLCRTGVHETFPFVQKVIVALFDKNRSLCGEILDKIILEKDHYRATTVREDCKNKKSGELVRSHLEFVLSIPSISDQRKVELVTRQIQKGDKPTDLPMAHKLISLKPAEQYAKLTYYIMQALFETGYTEAYEDLYQRLHLEDPEAKIENLFHVLIAMHHYNHQFTQTLLAYAIAAGKHDAEYLETVSGRLSYISIYEGLKTLREKLIQGIPTIMSQPIEKEEKEDLQRFCAIINGQAENILIFPEMNKLEAKDKAMQRYEALKARRK